MSSELRFDEVGYWSEIKLEIIRKYAKAYSAILTSQKRFSHIYIDAFAGAGTHLSRTTGEVIEGSPKIALQIDPPFREYHFVELDLRKAENLSEIAGERTGVFVYRGDCNQILPDSIYPRVKYEDFRRGLCLLDPYGLHLNWRLMADAGKLKTIDMFLNFPVMDMNRNVIWRHPDGVKDADILRMNAFWGDESWRDVAYTREEGLFGPIYEKSSNDTIAEAFRERLKREAEFDNVASPLPMRNKNGAVVYYLFFASQRPVAVHIVQEIFRKYATIGGPDGQ